MQSTLHAEFPLGIKQNARGNFSHAWKFGNVQATTLPHVFAPYISDKKLTASAQLGQLVRKAIHNVRATLLPQTKRTITSETEGSKYKCGRNGIIAAIFESAEDYYLGELLSLANQTTNALFKASYKQALSNI